VQTIFLNDFDLDLGFLRGIPLMFGFKGPQVLSLEGWEAGRRGAETSF